jgi:hypothetical protein
MARFERYGIRSLVFSGWHRTLNDHTTMIDIDDLEYCRRCREPIVLIENARDIGQDFKPTIVLAKLARRAGVLAFLIYYRLSTDEQSIVSFRVRQVEPPDDVERILTPDEMAVIFDRWHTDHRCADGFIFLPGGHQSRLGL